MCITNVLFTYLLVLLSPRADAHFIFPWRVEPIPTDVYYSGLNAQIVRSWIYSCDLMHCSQAC